MKPNILVLYYTQSGQLRDIIDEILKDIQEEASVDIVAIKPEKDFPFPWKSYAFFDAMPETVERVPVALQPLPGFVSEKNYDLVILGYQPWFLNPSQPTTGLLRGPYAGLLKNKPVLTVIGCRNMWLHGQEEVKKDLKSIGAKLVGHIVLEDTHPNLVSLLTIIRWAFTGKKEASGRLPEAGVPTENIKKATRFGKTILTHTRSADFQNLQPALLQQGAINLKPGLILLEQRGIKNFKKFARFIRAKGGPGDPLRRGRVLLFKRLLLVGIFVLSPVTSASAFLQLQLRKKRLLRDLDYFKSVSYEEGRI